MLDQQFLDSYMINNENLDGIVISDKDGVELFSTYKLNKKNQLQKNSFNFMLCNTFQSTNDNLIKLTQTIITLFHDDLIVHITSLKNLLVFIYCDVQYSNISMLDDISKDLVHRLENLDNNQFVQNKQPI